MNRTAELLRLVQTCQRIDGRKKLQKLVHILREAGYPFPYRYVFHLHGPFSAELKREIDTLVDENLLDEKESSTKFGEFAQYEYRPTDSTHLLLSELDNEGNRSTAWEPLALELNSKSAQELEAISTILYLLRSGTNRDDLKTRFEGLKPQLAGNYHAAQKTAFQIVKNQLTVAS